MDVCRYRVQVDGAHRVAHHLSHLPERLMVLMVFPATEETVSAYVDEILRLIEVLAVPRLPIEFHEGHLDFLMAVGAQALAFLLWPERAADVVCKPTRYLQ